MPWILTVTTRQPPNTTHPAPGHDEQGELEIFYSVPCVRCHKLIASARWTLNAFCDQKCFAASNANTGAAGLPTPPNSPTTAPSGTAADTAPTPARIDDSDDESDAIVDANEIEAEVNALRLESSVAAAFRTIYLQIDDIGEAASSGNLTRGLVRRLAASLERKVERSEKIYHEQL
ncbi:hypothetical protein C8R46DRAFT_1025277 [Mycena filopes]|nr:hypothetical protein C8R46DRAFT_1025277 [Mycena filopes]